MKLSYDDDGTAPELREAYDSCRNALVGTMGFSCLINLLMFTGPLFMLQVYDRVLASRSVPTLWALVAIVVVLYLFMGLLELVRSRIMVRVGRRVAQHLNGPLFERVVRLGLNRGRGTEVHPLKDLETVKRFLAGPAPSRCSTHPGCQSTCWLSSRCMSGLEFWRCWALSCCSHSPTSTSIGCSP